MIEKGETKAWIQY